MAQAQQPGPWAREIDDFGRAFGGAFLFGIPLLFTMEMWWIGEHPELWRIVAFFVAALAINVYLAEISGFRRQSSNIRTLIDESVDSLAVGIVAAFVVLLVLNRISFDQPLSMIVASVAIEAIPLSIGASVADTVFTYRSGHNQGDEERPQSNQTKASPLRASINDMGATAIGGLFIGISIAPTDEIPMLATGMNFTHQAALVVLILLVTYLIVFESGFSPQQEREQDASIFRRPLTQTFSAYIVCVVVAFAALYFFHRIDLTEPPGYILSQVTVFSFPIAIGGAAGRLVL